MTVKELKEELSKFDDSKEVLFPNTNSIRGVIEGIDFVIIE